MSVSDAQSDAALCIHNASLTSCCMSQARFKVPQRAITPQQSAVLYDGDVCLGTALVRYPAPSLYEEQLTGSASVAQRQQQLQPLG